MAGSGLLLAPVQTATTVRDGSNQVRIELGTHLAAGLLMCTRPNGSSRMPEHVT